MVTLHSLCDFVIKFYLNGDGFVVTFMVGIEMGGLLRCELKIEHGIKLKTKKQDADASWVYFRDSGKIPAGSIGISYV